MQLESTGYSDFGVVEDGPEAGPDPSPTHWATLLPGRADLSWRPMRVRIGIACVVAALAIVAGVRAVAEGWQGGDARRNRAHVDDNDIDDNDIDDNDNGATDDDHHATAAPVRSGRCCRPRGASCTTLRARRRRPGRCRTRRSSTCRSPSSSRRKALRVGCRCRSRSTPQRSHGVDPRGRRRSARRRQSNRDRARTRASSRSTRATATRCCSRPRWRRVRPRRRRPSATSSSTSWSSSPIRRAPMAPSN